MWIVTLQTESMHLRVFVSRHSGEGERICGLIPPFDSLYSAPVMVSAKEVIGLWSATINSAANVYKL
jgi:hypothetical protein